MSEIIPFDFGDTVVRVQQEQDGRTWFVAKDVCRVLDLDNRETPRRLDEDEVGKTHIVDSLGRNQEMTMLSESGLYALIFKSRKPEAKKFRKWITAEVIPSLRRTGKYEMGQDNAPADFDLHKELYPLLTKWCILLKEKEVWQPQDALEKAVTTMQSALGRKSADPLNSLTPQEVNYAKEYLNTQIAILTGKSAEVKTPEEIEAATLRSQKARKAARARWDKAKGIGR
ncbi:BRO-N domain-containing protein [Maridesulfovibrio bastinii]|uniref:BRO-N domain-containing protein n=1 Tax=Maridesulfovibrio bastinii TaxID=47157 RepID=UPI000412AE19|nr:Bro-N domain-containing protein [Maridesulfovibrio bastinii]